MAPSKAAIQETRVLVVGDTMLDRYWFGAVDRISPEAPVPVVRVGREEYRAGGAANVALNARALGAQVTLLGLSGDDEPAHRLFQLMERAGVVCALRRHAALRTIVKLRVIGRAQQLIRLDFESAPAEAAKQELVDDFTRAVEAHDVVIFSDYGKGTLALVASMIEVCRASGRPCFVDPKGNEYGRYVGATGITPNQSEMQAVTGVWRDADDLAERGEALRRQLAVDTVVLTRSEDGMTLFDAAGTMHVAARAREVFDVTGAGDTVIAVLSTLVGAGSSVRDAMQWANQAAGIVVGKFGTASVTWAELSGSEGNSS